MIRYTFVLLFCLFLSAVHGQDLQYVKKANHKLSSKAFHGRGYVKNGDAKAAGYIVSQFKKEGVKSFTENYYQPYDFSINTFPGKIVVKAGNRKLSPGTDFVISLSSPGLHGTFPLIWIPDTITTPEQLVSFIDKNGAGDGFLVLSQVFKKLYGTDLPWGRGAILLEEKQPWWHVSNGKKTVNSVWLKIDKNKLPKSTQTIQIDFDNKFVEDYKTQNIAGYLEGTVKDTFLVFTAHYDHLGMMGNKAFFPGSNDNASGTSMVLDLARYYAHHPHKYSMAFILFSGEEAGLKGSTHFAENPLFPLNQIKLLVNLDMIGTGSEGITVVNGKVFTDIFQKMTSINDKNHYLPEIKSRGEACNSDHCPFYKKGVKAIFIYTRGKEYTEYHTVTDNHVPYTKYNDFFKLIKDQADSY
jgi:hypothetical protein